LDIDCPDGIEEGLIDGTLHLDQTGLCLIDSACQYRKSGRLAQAIGAEDVGVLPEESDEVHCNLIEEDRFQSAETRSQSGKPDQ
jgi:hypothetical protein